jgi:hypothetical protein
VSARLLAWCARPEPLPLAGYLLVAFALRVPAILCAHGHEFVDQQFQYVDPAWHLASGATWWRTWEYEVGMRSWAYPGFLAGVFRALAALGFAEPLARLAAVRAVHAAVTLLPLAALWLCVARWRPLAHGRAVCLFAAASGLLVYTGVQPNAPWFAAHLAVAAALFAGGPGWRWPALAGALLGLAFACRVQDALLFPVLGLALLMQRRPRAVAALALGGLVPVVAQGALDACTWGGFLHSPITYVRRNLFEGAAASFGRDPLWLYVAAVAVVTAVAPGWWRSLRAGARALPLAAACGVAYVVLHALLERKAVRFVVTALILLSLVAATGAFRAGASRWHRGVLVAVHLLLLAFLSWFPFHRGPIAATLALREQRDLRVLYLVHEHAGHLALGGHYYLDRREGEVSIATVPRAQLAGRLAGERAPVVHVLAAGEPLAPGDVPAGWRAEPLGSFHAAFGLRARDRRHVYRLSPTDR